MKRERSAYYKEYYEKNKERLLAQKKSRSKEYRKENKEAKRQRSKIYYEKNKERILEKMSVRMTAQYRADPARSLTKQKEWKTKNQELYLLQGAKHRAKKYNLLFNITVEDIFIPEVCPYLGIRLAPFSGGASPSLDKINPERGYVKGNVQVISTKANTMKNDATREELILFAKYIISIEPEPDGELL